MSIICEPIPFQWTRETYERAGELGFFGDLRVELVEGQVVQTSPMGSKHAGVTGIFIRLLNSAFGTTPGPAATKWLFRQGLATRSHHSRRSCGVFR